MVGRTRRWRKELYARLVAVEFSAKATTRRSASSDARRMSKSIPARARRPGSAQRGPLDRRGARSAHRHLDRLAGGGRPALQGALTRDRHEGRQTARARDRRI